MDSLDTEYHLYFEWCNQVAAGRVDPDGGIGRTNTQPSYGSNWELWFQSRSQDDFPNILPVFDVSMSIGRRR
jgi:hypothetical protein